MQYPLVSAIVLCYNHARFVVECLESVKAQNYPNLELIVNDDASRDDSASVIRAWLAQNTIPHRFLRQETNQGLCRSANQALSHARGKYISGIAADDVWLPGKLQTQVELLERLPEKVGVVYSDALQMDESGNTLPAMFIESHRRFESLPQGNIAEVLWEGNFIPAMTTLVRKACFDRVGGYDESLFFEDWDMWLRIAHHYDFVYSETVSAKYRHVATSMVRAAMSRVIDATCAMCLKHLRREHLSPITKKAAIEQLCSKAMYSYKIRTPRHRYNLLQAVRFRSSIGLMPAVVFACFGLSHEVYSTARLSAKGAVQK